MRIFSIALLFAAMALTSACNDIDEPAQAADDNLMSFTVSHPSASRATATAFEEGDVIGLYVTSYTGDVAAPLQISGNWANNVAMTLTAGEWLPARNVFWCDGKADVYAYYPYMTPTSIDEHYFEVAADQSTERSEGKLGGYEASDFLWAKAAAVEQTAGAVALQFKHSMSKLLIKLVKGPNYKGELPDNADMYLYNTVLGGTIDFTNGSVTKYLYGEPATIKMRKVDNETYEAVVIPQRVDSRRPFIEMVVNGVSYLLEDTFNFKPGKLHTISLQINSNPDQVSVDIGGEVVDEW